MTTEISNSHVPDGDPRLAKMFKSRYPQAAKKREWEVIEGMSSEDYFAHPAISRSGLSKINRSPRHFLTQQSETTAMLEGKAFHCAVLEPDHFNHRYSVAPSGIDRRTKEGKASWTEFVESSKGTIVLTAEQGEKIKDMQAGLNDVSIVSDLLADGRAEVSAFWQEKCRGLDIKCKCRPDFVSSDGEWMVDLKTTSGFADPESFSKTVANFAYHSQAAWYLRGWEAVSGILPTFVFVVVENKAPWGVAAYTLDESAIAEGWLRSLAALRKFADWVAEGCEDTQGYPDEIQILNLPRWAFKETL